MAAARQGQDRAAAPAGLPARRPMPPAAVGGDGARAAMRAGAAPLAPGLYLVATPIGAARDITLHALDLLAGADLLVAEDTRNLRHLMEIHGLAPRGRPVLAFHDHAAESVGARILAALRQGQVVACCSDAGTPLLSDPGFTLVRAALAEGLPVHAAPGASALLAALTVAGLPAERFLFAGFLPPKRAARQAALAELAGVPAALVFYESPRRLAACLADMRQILGPDRPAALCRELTKRHEEVLRGTLGDLSEALADREVKGEIVLVLGRPLPQAAGADTLDEALRLALKGTSLKEAVAEVAQSLGLPRREVYQRALALAR